MSQPLNRSARIEARVIRLTVEEQRRFVEVLLDPPAVTPALKRAKRAHARLIAPTISNNVSD